MLVAITFPDGPYVGMTKVPNTAIVLDSETIPRVVIESRVSQPVVDIRNDMNQWLIGGNGRVEAVILIIWTRTQNNTRFEGYTELYTPDSQGMPRLKQREVNVTSCQFGT